MRKAGGAWIGWSGDAGPAPGAFEADGLHLVGLSLSETEVRHFYEGFCNATLWPLYHDVIAPPQFHRRWWEAYVTVNRRFAQRRGGTGGAGRDRLGARLPAPAGPADAARAARRRPDRLLQPHPVPRLRDLRPASVAAAGGGGAARRRPARLPAPGRRHQLPARLPPGRRPDHQGVHRAGRRTRRLPGGPRRRVPDLDRRRGPGRDRPARRGRQAGRAKSARPWASRAWCCWAWTGSTTPRASCTGCGPTESWSTRGGWARGRCWSRWPARAGSGSRPTRRSARRSRGQSAGSTASTGRWATPPSTTCTSPSRARRWPRCTWPRT